VAPPYKRSVPVNTVLLFVFFANTGHLASAFVAALFGAPTPWSLAWVAERTFEYVFWMIRWGHMFVMSSPPPQLHGILFFYALGPQVPMLVTSVCVASGLLA
jgi:hypothetical protein